MKKLNNILNGIKYSGKIDERVINAIFYDSRKVQENSLFIAIKGINYDGHQYIDQAIKLGANAIVVDKIIQKSYSIPILKVKNTRKAMSQIASNFFGDCSKNIKITAVTGTNGKTTIIELVNYILENNNYQTSSLGTLGFKGPSGVINTGFTTPESLELQQIFYILNTGGITHLNMEISSHAIKLNRVDNVDVDIAVFTNLTNEHLDFHGTINNYFNTKLKLFKNLSANKIAIINNDDIYSKKIKNQTKAKVFTYGFDSNSDIFPEKIMMDLKGSAFYVNYKNKRFQINTNLIGNFNISNILASILVCKNIGLKMRDIINSINNFKSVSGRCEFYAKKNGGIIIIDYAHTPDAFEKILSTIKGINSKKQIITLFGCGGNRDKSKRSIMGEISDKYSNKTIITDDNPRYESSEEIISQILSGFKTRNYEIINNRKRALEKSINELDDSKVLLVLGKGAENYQIIKDKKIYHSDLEIIKKLI